ncbi:hypothetical protein CFC21_002851 [Triticum aestivum]|uniref:Uncharacterized protein n=2 Tax=Triticum TaxID=4564 RepID=A0A9R0UYQ2_TRITD|nr:hypothetical protein CFC21_002851 [Triticum aestivum]VAH07824.1 unnamed protein product [Triticum turgidum subsp. durum]
MESTPSSASCEARMFRTPTMPPNSGFRSSPATNSCTTLSTSIRLHPGVFFMLLLLIDFLVLATSLHRLAAAYTLASMTRLPTSSGSSATSRSAATTAVSTSPWLRHALSIEPHIFASAGNGMSSMRLRARTICPDRPRRSTMQP